MKFLPTRPAPAWAVLAVVCMGLFSASMAQEADDALAVSSRRVALLQRLVRAYFAEAGPGTTDFAAQREILRRFSRAEPECPTGAIATAVRGDEQVEAAVTRIVDELLAKKFPTPDEAKLKTEAQARYPIYEKGDLVEFYYATNPQNIRKVRGVYQGRNARLVQVGSKVVQLEDIARVKGNEDLLMRFEKDASEELRKTYVAEKLATYEVDREAYERKANQYTRSKERDRARRMNESEGYLFVDGRWLIARDLVSSLIAGERERIARVAREAADRKVDEKRRRLAVAADRQAAHEPEIVAAAYQDVDAAFTAFQERLATAASAPVAPPVAPVDPSPGPSPDTAVAAVPSPAPAAPEGKPEEAQLLPTWAYGAIGGIAVLGIIIGIVVYRRNAAGPGSDLKKFFQGRGKVQRTFWHMAEEKPDTFKYVAYRYPTSQDARQALLQLSYVNERVGGDLVCRHDVYFGYGPHQDKFVTFVGGETLHYALWREASAVFPEFPGAEYFRVSTAPDVNLEIPNLDSLLADPELQIEHVENREGEGTDYSQYYVYKAPGKESALAFLQHATIQEAGLHVVVLTKEGIFGKDENGIYEESMDLWSERYPEFFGA